MDKIRKTAVKIKTHPEPSLLSTIRTPPNNGPITFEPCLAIPRKEIAFSKCSRGTRLGINASDAGVTAANAVP